MRLSRIHLHLLLALLSLLLLAGGAACRSEDDNNNGDFYYTGNDFNGKAKPSGPVAEQAARKDAAARKGHKSGGE